VCVCVCVCACVCRCRQRPPYRAQCPGWSISREVLRASGERSEGLGVVHVCNERVRRTRQGFLCFPCILRHRYDRTTANCRMRALLNGFGVDGGGGVAALEAAAAAAALRLNISARPSEERGVNSTRSQIRIKYAGRPQAIYFIAFISFKAIENCVEYLGNCRSS
jgi:hypothetical protein